MATRRPSAHRPAEAAVATLPTSPPPAPTTFEALGVPAPLIGVLAATGIDVPFPIQAATLPDSLAGRDVLGKGRTGSGKTLAFVLPLLTRLSTSGTATRPGRPRALVLAPTRELAAQIEAIAAPLARRLGLRTCTVYGGVGPGPQIKALRSGVDLVIACPGRLGDHISQGHANLGSVEITVLDEADHMADLGFLPVVKKLLDQTPPTGQRMLFSATLDGGVDVLVRRYLRQPVTHSVEASVESVGVMDHHVLHVQAADRFGVLADLAAAPGRTLVFTRTKHAAKKLTRQLIQAGVPTVELHGNLAQNARTRNLAMFSDGSAPTMVATDIAARGIHVDEVALVVHADPPVEHKAYLHRSGRTARAGSSGTVVTLMTDAQVADVRDLTRKAGIRPTTSKVRAGDPLLARLAPGERTFVEPPPPVAAVAPLLKAPGVRQGGGRPGQAGRGQAGRGRSGSGQGRIGRSSPSR